MRFVIEQVFGRFSVLHAIYVAPTAVAVVVVVFIFNFIFFSRFFFRRQFKSGYLSPNFLSLRYALFKEFGHTFFDSLIWFRKLFSLLLLLVLLLFAC